MVLQTLVVGMMLPLFQLCKEDGYVGKMDALRILSERYLCSLGAMDAGNQLQESIPE